MDGGHRDGDNWARTPAGCDNEEQRAQAVARARHETVNGRFKVFGALKQQRRRGAALRGKTLRSIADITQATIARGLDPLFDVDCNEADCR